MGAYTDKLEALQKVEVVLPFFIPIRQCFNSTHGFLVPPFYDFDAIDRGQAPQGQLQRKTSCIKKQCCGKKELKNNNGEKQRQKMHLEGQCPLSTPNLENDIARR
jgi:hypothetical protein